MDEIAESRFGALMSIIAALSVILYLAVCTLAAVYLNINLTITPDDIKYSSWIISPTTATHFTTGPLVMGLSATMLLVGIGVGVAKSSVFSVLPALLLVTALNLAGSAPVLYGAGIDTGGIKIGCYVPESKTCREQLGLPITESTIRTYNLNSDDGLYTPEYRARRSELGYSGDEGLGLNIPGAVFLRAPITAMHLPDIKEKIRVQRLELETLKSNR